MTVVDKNLLPRERSATRLNFYSGISAVSSKVEINRSINDLSSGWQRIKTTNDSHCHFITWRHIRGSRSRCVPTSYIHIFLRGKSLGSFSFRLDIEMLLIKAIRGRMQSSLSRSHRMKSRE